MHHQHQASDFDFLFLLNLHSSSEYSSRNLIYNTSRSFGSVRLDDTMLPAAIVALLLCGVVVDAGSDSHEAIRRHSDLAKKQDGFNGYMSVGYYVSLTPRDSPRPVSECQSGS